MPADRPPLALCLAPRTRLWHISDPGLRCNGSAAWLCVWLFLVCASARRYRSRPAPRWRSLRQSPRCIPPRKSSVPRTLIEALAATYLNQPALQAERAKLRATDENVPTALAGWRPTVVWLVPPATAMACTREYLTTVSPAQNVKLLNPRADRHGPGHGHPEPLYRRQDVGQRQPLEESGDGRSAPR